MVYTSFVLLLNPISFSTAQVLLLEIVLPLSHRSPGGHKALKHQGASNPPPCTTGDVSATSLIVALTTVRTKINPKRLGFIATVLHTHITACRPLDPSPQIATSPTNMLPHSLPIKASVKACTEGLRLIYRKQAEEEQKNCTRISVFSARGSGTRNTQKADSDDFEALSTLQQNCLSRATARSYAESLCLTEERHGLGEGHPDTSAIRNELRSSEPKETEELVFISPSFAFRWAFCQGMVTASGNSCLCSGPSYEETHPEPKHLQLQLLLSPSAIQLQNKRRPTIPVLENKPCSSAAGYCCKNSRLKPKCLCKQGKPEKPFFSLRPVEEKTLQSKRTSSKHGHLHSEDKVKNENYEHNWAATEVGLKIPVATRQGNEQVMAYEVQRATRQQAGATYQDSAASPTSIPALSAGLLLRGRTAPEPQGIACLPETLFQLGLEGAESDPKIHEECCFSSSSISEQGSVKRLEEINRTLGVCTCVPHPSVGLSQLEEQIGNEDNKALKMQADCCSSCELKRNNVCMFWAGCVPPGEQGRRRSRALKAVVPVFMYSGTHSELHCLEGYLYLQPPKNVQQGLSCISNSKTTSSKVVSMLLNALQLCTLKHCAEVALPRGEASRRLDGKRPLEVVLLRAGRVPKCYRLNYPGTSAVTLHYSLSSIYLAETVFLLEDTAFWKLELQARESLTDTVVFEHTAVTARLLRRLAPERLVKEGRVVVI
ncbi:hypothetical protein Anapl_14442 [Anas platyrhynchos]|uniref:Uncharacterized protein n=1 Tax=Anas platyrhynchos TaxID=8839 RepID=R0JSP5_ANAPL|nr:hypothetical protein Anapl_14442 [Anas platyrhynchos]